MQLNLFITPSGRIVCEPNTDLPDEVLSEVTIDETTSAELLQSFGDSSAAGLLHLAGLSDKVALPLSFVFWRCWTQRFLKSVAHLDDEHIAALEKAADEFIRDHKAVPSFKNFKGYPYASCISVNDAVVHGFPSERPLQASDRRDFSRNRRTRQTRKTRLKNGFRSQTV